MGTFQVQRECVQKQVQVLPWAPRPVGEGLCPQESLAPVQSELLTLKCLGFRLGCLDGGGGGSVADPLGIWQPRVLEP